MESKLSKSARTRQFIIETTANLFNKKGYAGTSLSDLTNATGLTKGSIYGNFENKEEVALAVFDYNHAKIQGEVQKRMALATSYYDKLLVYVRVYDQYTVKSFPEGGCPILNTAVEADDTHNLLKDKAAKAVLKWQKAVQQLIRAGMEAGEFRPDVDVSRMALSLIALIEGGIMISKVTDNRQNLDKVMKTVEGLLTQMKV